MIILEKHPVSGYEPRHYRREPSGSVGVGGWTPAVPQRTPYGDTVGHWLRDVTLWGLP